MRFATAPPVLAAVILLCAASASAHAAPSPLRAATTVGEAEAAKTIPITPKSGAKPRVAISLGAQRMPTLKHDDRLRGLGEVQVTNTCVARLPRCIGRPYGFNPRITAWLVLARGRHVTGGAGARRISGRQRVECGQHRPNRNHHCVLVLSDGAMHVHAPGHLPCQPDRCFLNLVVAAHHPNARHGNRLIIGADRPDGSVQQGKGRVSALVIRSGAHPHADDRGTARLVRHTVPMSSDGGWVPVYSIKLAHLHAGDVITAEARKVLDISNLDHAVFDDTRIVLTDRRRKVRPGRIARRSASPSGLDEANGFNCTHGPSAYRTPCVSRKVGQVRISRDPVNHRGRPAPLYVNLVCRGLLKLAQKRPPVAHLKHDGHLRIRHYRAS